MMARLFLVLCLFVSVGYGQVIERVYQSAEAFVIDLDVSSSEHIIKASSIHDTTVRLDLDRMLGIVSEPGGDYILTNLVTEQTRSDSGKLRVVYRGTIIFDMGTEKEVVKDVMFTMGSDYVEFHLPYTSNSVYCIIYREGLKKYKA